MRRAIALLFLAALCLPLFAASGTMAQSSGLDAVLEREREPAVETIHVAQRKKRRTLLDLLFGNEEEEPEAVEQPRRQQQQQEQPTRPRRQQEAQPEASLPPAKPAIEKAPGATRLAVFGDSMAVDLAKALDRFYAEDPNIAIVPMGVGSSGFVREDFFDWNKTIAEQIAGNTFDLAVVIIGINDRQTLNADGQSHKALTEGWTAAYTARVNDFLSQLRAAGKPVIWIGLPPMEANSYSNAISQISAIHRMASFSGGAEFLDIYERFVDEEGRYSSFGPDLNGQRVRMRKDDGIHFSAAGADKLAFYLSQSIKLYYRGGGAVGIEVADPLAGTDAQLMVRPPYQGLGQIRQLEVAGAVIPLSHAPRRAVDLVTFETAATAPAAFDMEMLVQAPAGRVDAFGAGITPQDESFNAGGR